ncbi:hypothetical protein EDD17DRAFT_1523932, partial [Pisolithus thermaeus]
MLYFTPLICVLSSLKLFPATNAHLLCSPCIYSTHIHHPTYTTAATVCGCAHPERKDFQMETGSHGDYGYGHKRKISQFIPENEQWRCTLPQKTHLRR